MWRPGSIITPVAALSPALVSGVQFDAAALSSLSGSGTSFSDNFTVGNNSNRALIVAFVFDAIIDGTVSNVAATYNGVDMGSALGHIGNHNAGDIYFFGLPAPAVGTNALGVTWTTTAKVWFIALSAYNADQTGGATTFHDFTTATNTGTHDPSVTVPNVASGEIVFAAYSTGATFTTTGSGTTDIGKDNSSGTYTDPAGNYATGASGSVVMSYSSTVGPASYEAAAGVAIKAA